MAIRTVSQGRRRIEPTIALINVVFLMLVFFLVAGTLAKPLDRELKLVSVSDLEAAPPPDALVVYPDGRMTFRGEETDPASHVAQRAVEVEVEVGDAVSDASADGKGPAGPLVRIVPDRELAAGELVRIGAELRAAGAGRLVVVTERALQ